MMVTQLLMLKAHIKIYQRLFEKIIKIWMFSSHNDKIILQLINLVCF